MTLKKCLHTFWLNDYFDITFLTYNNHRLQKRIEPSSAVLPILNQINSFFKNYISHVVSSKSEWFPNKLLDMNGYTLDVAIQPVNYSSEYEYNRGIKFLKILQQEMNFQLNLEQIYFPNGGSIWLYVMFNHGKGYEERHIRKFG